MIALRLNRLQLGLAVAAALLFVGAIAAVIYPAPALPAGQPVVPGRATGATFEPALPVVARDAESPLVERNPFDDSRRPPVRRRTGAADEEELGLGQAPVPSFVLLGTVVTGGRDLAVIQGNPLVPGGSVYHVGDEVAPGYRVVRITRTGAVLSGGGRQIELTVGGPGPAASF